MSATPVSLTNAPFSVPHQLRERAIRRHLSTMGADAAQVYMAVRCPDQTLRLHGVRGIGANPMAAERWAAGDGLVFMLGEAEPDDAAPINRLAEAKVDFQRTPMFRYAFAEVGYHAAWYMNVTQGNDHRGFVAFTRRAMGPWTVSSSIVNTVSRAIVTAFLDAWADEERRRPPAGTLQLSAGGVPTGPPELVSWALRMGVRRMHEAATGPSPMGTSALVWAPASFAQVLPLPDGGQAVQFQPVTATTLPPMLTELSSTLRTVATLAARGLTVPEMAQQLDRSPDTIRESLARIYARIGVSNRSELASAVRRTYM